MENFTIKELSKQIEVIINQVEDYSIILLDTEGLVQSWGKSSQHIFGFSAEEVIKKPIDKLFQDLASSDTFKTRLLSIAKKEGSYTEEGWLRHASNNVFWAELNLKAINNEKNKFIGFSLVVKNEDELKLNQQLLEVTNNIANVGGWQVDLGTMKVLWTNTTKQIHETPADFVPTVENGLSFYEEGINREKITMAFQELVDHGTPFEEEVILFTHKGNTKLVRSKGYADMVNGKVVRVYGSFQDLTDEKEKEAEIQKSQERFEKVFKHSPNGMAIIGTNGQWINFNVAICEMLGYTREELKRKTFQETTYPDDIDEEVALINDLISGKIDHYRLEKRYITKDGSILWGSLAVSAIKKKNGEVDYFITQINDTTKRKVAEQQNKRNTNKILSINKELEQFAYITSHDLQEPLRTISSFGNLLSKKLDGRLDLKETKYLDFMMDASDRMRKQINGLLEFNRLGRISTKKTEFSLSKIVDLVINDLNTLIQENNAVIKINDLPLILGHEAELKNLFQNLIHNAIKFREKDVSPEITITSRELKNFFEISIKDNGIGIAEEYHEKIFQIFQRLKNRKDYEGSGIGLANCKKVVALHAGKIWVKSSPNEGSTFLFTLKK